MGYAETGEQMLQDTDPDLQFITEMFEEIRKAGAELWDKVQEQ